MKYNVELLMHVVNVIQLLKVAENGIMYIQSTRKRRLPASGKFFYVYFNVCYNKWPVGRTMAVNNQIKK